MIELLKSIWFWVAKNTYGKYRAKRLLAQWRKYNQLPEHQKQEQRDRLREQVLTAKTGNNAS